MFYSNVGRLIFTYEKSTFNAQYDANVLCFTSTRAHR